MELTYLEAKALYEIAELASTVLHQAFTAIDPNADPPVLFGWCEYFKDQATKVPGISGSPVMEDYRVVDEYLSKRK